MRGKIIRIIRACELSEPMLCYILINGNELCPEQACELSGPCKLARVKLSGVHCMWIEAGAVVNKGNNYGHIPLMGAAQMY